MWDKTGIDPFTIYQDNFTEKVLHDEHPYLQGLDIAGPSVFVDNNGQMVRLSEHVDVEVIHPKTQYVNGRPDWLYQNDKYQEYHLDRAWADIDYPLFFAAYQAGEQDLGTPVDIIELKTSNDYRPLILPPGNYVIKVDNKRESREMTVTCTSTDGVGG